MKLKLISSMLLKKKINFLMIIVGLIIIFFLIKRAGVERLADIFVKLNPIYVFFALAMWLISLLFGAYRLKKLISDKLSYPEVFKVSVYGFLLNYGSAVQGLGMLAKMGLLKKKEISLSKSSAGVSSEVVYDILFTLIATGIFLLIAGEMLTNKFKEIIDIGGLIIILLVGLIALLTAFLLKRKKIFQEYISDFLFSFKVKNIFNNMSITAFVWFFSCLATFFYFKAADSLVSIWWIIGSASIGYLLGLISFIPGGLGVRDAIWAYGYSLSGVPIELAVSVTLITRFLSIFFVVLLVMIIELYKLIPNKQ